MSVHFREFVLINYEIPLNNDILRKILIYACLSHHTGFSFPNINIPFKNVCHVHLFFCRFINSDVPLFSTQLTILLDFYHYREHTDKAHIFELLIK